MNIISRRTVFSGGLGAAALTLAACGNRTTPTEAGTFAPPPALTPKAGQNVVTQTLTAAPNDRLLSALAQHGTHSRVAVSVAVIALFGAILRSMNLALTRVGPEGIEPSTRGLKVGSPYHLRRCSANALVTSM